MNQPPSFDANAGDDLRVLSEDAELVFCRGWRSGAEGGKAALAVFPVAAQPRSATLNRLTHEYSLKDELDGTWALRPLELVQDRGRTVLVLEDPGGDLLSRLLGMPMDVERFLSIAVCVAEAVGKVHQRGLIHKDIKPANILVNRADGNGVGLTGFGMASRLVRERQRPGPPEFIAGTLAYMAPEQTGRMNRSIDSRSDLYSLGVTFYEMLTGGLPFTASDPMEWVHCHIARQASPPSERASAIPEVVSSVVMKLLAKTAEERYQTATGVEADLRHCLIQWQLHGHIDPFVLGAYDASDRLLIAEELYGREAEIAALLAAFNRVVTQGTPELVLVSGYSGVGKSSVVNELHKVLVPTRGLFAAGKFDQYKRDIPYATLAQAFETLIRQLLVKSEAEVDAWRHDLAEALGSQGQLIVNLVPELELIIGKQPAVPDLRAPDAQNRFKSVLRRFIGVFAKPDHPLALFLDDLQWMDAASLDLIEYLTTRSEVPYLLLVGAYRDNEVGSAHPLLRTMEAIRKAEGRLCEIVLAPLALGDVGRLTASALYCDPERARPLSQLVYEKTGGNPFFAIQFLMELDREGLLAFDPVAQTWRWEIDHIHAKGYTDNVVDLMVEKLKRLSPRGQEALKLLACLGHVAEITTLAVGHEETEEAMHATLWEAVYAGLIDRSDGAYRFLHDRIQQAAYSLIPEEHRVDMHLQIGRALLANLTADQASDHLFDLANQLNRGAALITSRDEREQLAGFNLMAGKRAKAAAAYASALNYLNTGADLLTADAWERRHELFFSLELNRAECEFLIGDLSAAERRLAMLSSRASDPVEQSAVECLRVDLYHTLSQPDRAIAVFLDYLKKQGIEWSPHPTSEEVRREYEQVYSRLGSRTIEEIVDLPLMTDPHSLATLDVLTRALAPTMLTDGNLLGLTICRMANLSLQHGNSDGSCPAYVWFGMIGRILFGNHKDGVRFGRLALELVERKNLRRFQGRTYQSFAENVGLWTEHIRVGCDLLRQAFEAADRIGDVTYAVYSSDTLGRLVLASGQPLAEVQREAEACLEFATAAHFGFVIDVIIPQLGLIRSLRGLSSKFGLLDSEQFSESIFEADLGEGQRQVIADCFYCIRKLQARFYAGEYSAGLAASQGADRLLWIPVAFVETAEYHFYTALCHAASADSDDAEERRRHLDALTGHYRQIAAWADQCPENFENRAALLGAELARIERRELEAERLYEHAIRSARANGFVQNEAIANECAGRFYLARGFERIANAYFREARECYLRWGADGKVQQLDRIYPHLAAPEAQRPVGIIGSPVQQLDVTSVVKASQVLSGEIELPKLIERLMTIAVENAGANRGVLILPGGDEFLIQAEAGATGDKIEVTIHERPITQTSCPESLVRYVIRTHESVIIDDASKSGLFSEDDYLRDGRSKSILCLPLIKQGELTGILLLENTLASHAFTPARIAMLELLTAQAAISLENTRLYSDLREREAKVRRLVDSNIIGIVIGNIDGRVQEANQAFLQIVGYDQTDVAAGCLRRTELTPPEWHDRDAQAVAEMTATGSVRPFEKEYFRKDGSRVPVLVGGATFGKRQDGVVVFAVDLSDRKRAEAELAHANRVATMGQLTASIAHEVNQPIAAALTDAETAARWLARRPPDLEKAEQAIDRSINNGRRAAGIIAGIRGLAKNAPSRRESVAINDTIVEVIALTRGEISKNRVVVQTELARDLPLIRGDRVQLQQIILNLIVNAIEAMSQTSDGLRDMLITTGRDSGEVRVVVRDTGPGLRRADTEQVFTAFYTTKPAGLGMGLSICRSIVEAHGGRLWATPNEPRGAAFCFTLPLVEANH